MRGAAAPVLNMYAPPCTSLSPPLGFSAHTHTHTHRLESRTSARHVALVKNDRIPRRAMTMRWFPSTRRTPVHHRTRVVLVRSLYPLREFSHRSASSTARHLPKYILNAHTLLLHALFHCAPNPDLNTPIIQSKRMRASLRLGNVQRKRDIMERVGWSAWVGARASDTTVA